MNKILIVIMLLMIIPVFADQMNKPSHKALANTQCSRLAAACQENKDQSACDAYKDIGCATVNGKPDTYTRGNFSN